MLSAKVLSWFRKMIFRKFPGKVANFQKTFVLGFTFYKLSAWALTTFGGVLLRFVSFMRFRFPSRF
jgi:hypothetical protein